MKTHRRLCYISRCYREKGSAGTKAKTDYEKILCQMGAINLGLPRSFHNSRIVTLILNFLGVMFFVFRVKKNDVIFLQYPMKKYFTFVCEIASYKGAKTIIFIHDLGAFRRKKISPLHEIKKLKHADYIIAANESMARWLTENGYKDYPIAMGLHDYLSDSNPIVIKHNRPFNNIVYAGKLEKRKNSFLEKLTQNKLPYELQLFGKNKDLELQENDSIHLNHFIPDDVFISSIQADFGLIWDGESIEECSGAWGEYLKYNSPHKASFYLRAGLPLIIWKKAALAQIVEKEGIGLTIDSLISLDYIIKDITEEQMEQMRSNVFRVCNQIASGHSLKSALSKVLNNI